MIELSCFQQVHCKHFMRLMIFFGGLGIASIQPLPSVRHRVFAHLLGYLSMGIFGICSGLTNSCCNVNVNYGQHDRPHDHCSQSWILHTNMEVVLANSLCTQWQLCFRKSWSCQCGTRVSLTLGFDGAWRAFDSRRHMLHHTRPESFAGTSTSRVWISDTRDSMRDTLCYWVNISHAIRP